jgi:uncharacterized protein (DUF58 family)
MRRRYHFHPPGLLYLAMVVAVGAAAVHRPGNLLIWVFAALLSGVMLSGVLSGQPLMSVRAARSVPRTARVGEPLSVRYSVANGSRLWPLFAIFVREEGGPAAPRAFLRHVGPGRGAEAESVRWPERRGTLRFGAMRVESVFPFGLLGKSVRFEEAAECLVLPRVVPLRRGALESLAGGPLPGPTTTGRPGPGSDFLGIREYRPGDSLRHVAWRRSASGGPLAVIERSVDAPRRVRVAVDLRRATAALAAPAGGPAARELEEQAISLAASILSRAQQDGFETLLAVLGLPSPVMPARRGHGHLQRQLASLAALDLDAARDPSAGLQPAGGRAVTFVVQPVADPGAGAPDAVLLAASALDSLREEPQGGPA